MFGNAQIPDVVRYRTMYGVGVVLRFFTKNNNIKYGKFKDKNI